MSILVTMGAMTDTLPVWAAPDPGYLWVASGMPNYVSPTFSKSPAMSRTYTFDFGNFAELIAGMVGVTASVVATPGSLTVGLPVASGSVVTVQLSGGTTGVTYDVVCTLSFLTGGPLQQNGFLEVKAL